VIDFTARYARDAESAEKFCFPLRGRKTKHSSPIGRKEHIMEINQLSSKIIGAAIEVHKAIGPGLLESAYEKCLCQELKLRGFSFENQKPLPLFYKGEKLDCGYRMDVVVEKTIIVEMKSCEKIEPIHKAQLLTYLKLSGLRLGLILNFNVPVMRDGIARIANKLAESKDVLKQS
jgi:GxxExxY protein